MKRILFVILLFLSIFSNAYAVEVTLTCDPNTDYIQGYRIYQSDISGTYNKQTQKVSEVMVGQNIQPFFTIDVFKDVGSIVYFVATAFNEYGESDFSNELSWIVTGSPPDIPINLRRDQ